MKLYIGTNKVGSKTLLGMTVRSDKGEVLYSSKKYFSGIEGKFSANLEALQWGIKKFKSLCQNGTLPDDEKLLIFIGSKTIYSWFEKEKASEPYVVMFSDILLELSFLTSEVEIIHSVDCNNKVIFKNSNEDKGTKVTELFKDMQEGVINVTR